MSKEFPVKAKSKGIEKRIVTCASLALACVGSGRVQAGLATVAIFSDHVTGGSATFLDVNETKTATGQVVITQPDGSMTTTTMPAGGGTIKQAVAGEAFAGASVDLANQTLWAAAGFNSGSGYGASATADIHKHLTITAINSGFYDETIKIGLFDIEAPDGSFAIASLGTVVEHIRLEWSNIVLFDSETTLVKSATPGATSPDVVHDSTGTLTWIRTPGINDGIQGDVGGIPNPFTQTRWVLQPFSLEFNVLTNIGVNPGDASTQDLSLQWSHTLGESPGSRGLIGTSIIPEPSSLAIGMIATVMGLGYAGYRRREARRRPSRRTINSLARLCAIALLPTLSVFGSQSAKASSCGVATYMYFFGNKSPDSISGTALAEPGEKRLLAGTLFGEGTFTLSRVQLTDCDGTCPEGQTCVHGPVPKAHLALTVRVGGIIDSFATKPPTGYEFGQLHITGGGIASGIKEDWNLVAPTNDLEIITDLTTTIDLDPGTYHYSFNISGFAQAPPSPSERTSFATLSVVSSKFSFPSGDEVTAECNCVPEPSSAVLLGMGLAAIGLVCCERTSTRSRLPIISRILRSSGRGDVFE